MEEKKKVGRPKKSTTENKKPITQNELYDVLHFAQSYYDCARKGTFTPYLTNNRLGEISLTPSEIEETALRNALKNPVENQDTLIGYSEWLKFTEPISNRALNYMANLPSFDYTFTCINGGYKDFKNSEEYKKDLLIVKDFLNKFDVRNQFRYVHNRTLTNDSFYSVFRTDGGNYAFQELPRKYCQITGRNAGWGFLFDFDMNWFLQTGLDINQYPEVFKKMYNDVFNNNIDKYNPSNKLSKRDGTWALWTQTSPLPSEGNFACFKFNFGHYSNIPFLTPLFSDAMYKPLLRRLQNDQYIIASQKLLIGLIPLLKEQKTGQVKDAFAVDPDTLGKFLGVLAQGLANNINVKPVPFSDVKDVNFPLPEKNIYQDYSSSLSASSGLTSRLIQSYDRQSSLETQLSSEIDSFIATSVYPQYETWLSSMVNYLTKKYKFKFKMEGNNFSYNRKERLDNALKMSDKGLTLHQKIAAAIGMDGFELETQLAMSSASDYRDNLYLLLNTNTKDYGEEKNGRPKAEIPSDSTDRGYDNVY